MATAAANRRNGAPPASAQSEQQLLDAVLSSTNAKQQVAERLLDQIINRQASGRARGMADMLGGAIAKLKALLPDKMKSHAERLVNVASLYFSTREQMADCPPSQFVRCVFEAARIGLAIDGQLCHVVRYQSHWQCQPDYKGLIEVARATGRIEDIEAKEICENDHFVLEQINDGTRFEFSEADFTSDRGEIVGVWCRIWMPGRHAFKVASMRKGELEALRQRSPAGGLNKGPWSTDYAEMCKAKIIRRELKPYVGDPLVAAAVALCDAADGVIAEPQEPVEPPLPVGRQSLRKPKQQPADIDEQAQPEPPADDATDLDLQREEAELQFSEQIGAADTKEAVEAVAAQISEQKEFLGRELHGKLTHLATKRIKQIGG